MAQPDQRPRPPSPLHLFGLARPRLDLALSVTLLAAVVLSRIAVFPASIWEQDEAYFTAAVVTLDVAEQHPHPPWFPLWIGIGTALHRCGLAPARALQMASFGFSVWLPLPLVALWRRLLPGAGSAAAAALLCLAAPVVWLLAARAFAGTAATALMVAALACWVVACDGDGGWRPATGSVAAGLAVLVRPHFVVPLVIAGAITLGQRRGVGWRRIVLPGTLLVVVGGIIFAAAAGGFELLWRELMAHAGYHFQRLAGADRGLAASGLARGLGRPALAVAWLSAAVAGAAALLCRLPSRRAATVVVGALLALLVVTIGLSNPAHARYWVPVLALSAGLVVAACERLHRALGWVVVAVAVVASAIWVAPALPSYRGELSPPLAALRYADRLAADPSATLLVVDRTLVPFVDAERALDGSGPPVMFDHVLASGLVPAPVAERVVAVFDRGHDELLDGGERSHVFRCPSRVLRRLGQDRFLDVTVVDGARFATADRGTFPTEPASSE